MKTVCLCRKNSQKNRKSGSKYFFSHFFIFVNLHQNNINPQNVKKSDYNIDNHRVYH